MIQKINLILSSFALIGIIYVVSMKSTDTSEIAYVESVRLMQNFNEMKAVTLQYQEKAAVWQKRIELLSQELESEIQTYQGDKESLSKDQQWQTEQDLSKKQQEIAEYQQRLQNMLQLEDDESMKKILQKVNDAISEYGKNHNYQIIIAANGNNLAYANEAINITDDILATLNN